MDQQNQTTAPPANAAKFAFFYLLSLVALVFMAVSTGMVVFQIINKYVVDTISRYEGAYSDEALKFAISALIISVPIFYAISGIIYKSLFKGELAKNSGVRRWLIYFILLVSSVVMIGWAIGIINGFLNGELTIKFILKTLTALSLAAGIFSFYLYDIKRTEVAGKKDKVIKIYFIVSLVVVLAVFAVSLFVVESPGETRDRKIDEEVIRNFSVIDQCVSEYYKEKKNLPENLGEAIDNCHYAFTPEEEDKIKSGEVEYKKGEDKKYELCAEFITSNKDDLKTEYYANLELKADLHDKGWQCLERKVYESEVEIKGLAD